MKTRHNINIDVAIITLLVAIFFLSKSCIMVDSTIEYKKAVDTDVNASRTKQDSLKIK